MKNIFRVILVILIFGFTSVSAGSYSVNLKSSTTEVTKGSAVSVNISLDNIKDISLGLNVCQAKVSTSNVSIESVSGSNGWNVTSGSLLIFDSSSFIKSSGSIGVIKAKVNDAGSITLSNIVCSDGEGEYSASNSSISFKIKSESASTSTTKSNTSSNNKKNTTANKTTNDNKSSLLKSLVIDEIKFDFDKNKFEYNFDVDNSVNKINIKYELVDSSAKIVKNGSDELVIGKNTIIFNITNGSSSSKYIININRRDIVSEVENNEEVILNALKQDISLLKVKVNYSDDKYISSDILKYLKDNKKDIIYEVYDNDKVLYTFKVYGNNISDIDEINYNIRFNSNYNNTLSDKLKDYDYYIVNFDYRGKLPKGCEVVLNNINFISYIYLYYYDFNSDNVVFIKELDNNYNNSVTLVIDNTDEFVISNYKSDVFDFNIILYIVIGILVLIIILLILFRKKSYKIK